MRGRIGFTIGGLLALLLASGELTAQTVQRESSRVTYQIPQLSQVQVPTEPIRLSLSAPDGLGSAIASATHDAGRWEVSNNGAAQRILAQIDLPRGSELAVSMALEAPEGAPGGDWVQLDANRATEVARGIARQRATGLGIRYRVERLLTDVAHPTAAEIILTVTAGI